MQIKLLFAMGADLARHDSASRVHGPASRVIEARPVRLPGERDGRSGDGSAAPALQRRASARAAPLQPAAGVSRRPSRLAAPAPRPGATVERVAQPLAFSAPPAPFDAGLRISSPDLLDVIV